MSPTRRSFLKSSAAGAAAAVTASALPAAVYRRLNAAERVRIGIIGPGGMGSGHLGSFLHFHESGAAPVDIVAVSDCAIPRMNRALDRVYAKQEGVKPAGFQDYRELLGRDDVQGVLIASPEHWHAQMSIDAIQAGKDVYCEKPMTLTLDEAFAVKKVVDASDRIFQVGTQKMALSKWNVAKAMIAEGRIGKPLWSQTAYCRNTPGGEWNYYGIEKDLVPGETLDWGMWCGPKGERDWDPKLYHRWRRYKDFSTGIIGDLLVHEMTPLMYALSCDWPSRVYCSGGHLIDQDMENHDQVILNVEFPDGHTMVVAGATNNQQGLSPMVRGQMGTLYLSGKDCELRPENPFVDEVEGERVDCPAVADQDELRLNWLSCMQSREQPFSPVEFATKVMVAVDLATRSAWDGKAYVFDKAAMKAAPA